MTECISPIFIYITIMILIVYIIYNDKPGGKT